MTSPNLNFITDQAQILKCLTESFHKGNVVGVTSEGAGHILFLTSVENIFESGVTKEKIIVFKKFDVHGVVHEKHRIPLKQIDRVQSFQTLYKDSLKKTFRTIVSRNEANTNIRRIESFISNHELKIILIKLLDTSQRVRITISTRQAEPIEGFVKEIDLRFEKIVLSTGSNGHIKKELKIIQIEKISFDNYYSFRGNSSKVFHVHESSLKLVKAQ
jgi:hypothetical protein